MQSQGWFDKRSIGLGNNIEAFCINKEAVHPWASIMMLSMGTCRTHNHADKDDSVTYMVQILLLC
jgi:hypothetical protein